MILKECLSLSFLFCEWDSWAYGIAISVNCFSYQSASLAKECLVGDKVRLFSVGLQFKAECETSHQMFVWPIIFFALVIPRNILLGFTVGCIGDVYRLLSPNILSSDH